MSRLLLLTTIAAALSFSSLPTHANDKIENNDKKYLSLSVENDNFGGGTDRYYTSGVRGSWFNSKTNVPKGISTLADHIPTFDLDEDTATVFSIGHNLYTPEDITIESLQEDDRPWAAFLYGSVGLANITYHEDNTPFHIDELEFTLGIIGPEAMGKPIQRFVHNYITPEARDPRGWRNQLDFEPGLEISWQRRIPYALSYDIDGFHARFEPSFNISLGNIRTHAGAGATFVLSSDKELDTPPRVRPAIPGTGVFITEKKSFAWQVFAGVKGRLVGRNIFLDGNTFSDSHSVDKNYLVGDASAGVSFAYDDYRLSYTLNARSREFKNQDEESIFGSITLTKRF